MTKYQIPLTMFNTETITTKVVLGERDFKLMISMFENKIISRDQISREFFHDVSINTVNRRLRKLVGAALGAASSYLIHGALQRRDANTRRQTLLNLDKFSVSAPIRGQGVQDFRLSAPNVDQECFDWEIRGNQLVQQHCVWTIRGNAIWLPATRKRK